MSRRRSRWNFWKNVLVCALFAIVAFMSVLPLLEARLPFDRTTLTRLETVRTMLMELLVAAWFIALGGMIGSFINVVVWRMPRGVSIVSGGSACPWCLARIRLSDNIPVIGWLKLGGRCRVCHLPISPRYPIVEGILAGVFFVLFYVELRSGGGNLPGGSRYAITGSLQIVIATKWDVVAIYVFHAFLITMLLTWALMELDASRLPVRTIILALLVGAIAPLAWPWLQPVNWAALGDPVFGTGSAGGRMTTAFIGLSGGFLLGEFLRLNDSPAPRYVNNAPISLMTVGLFLGWQALATTAAISAILLAVSRFSTVSWFRRLPLTGVAALAALIQICLWRWIHEVVGGERQSEIRFAMAGLAGAVAAAIVLRHPASTKILQPSEPAPRQS